MARIRPAKILPVVNPSFVALHRPTDEDADFLNWLAGNSGSNDPAPDPYQSGPLQPVTSLEDMIILAQETERWNAPRFRYPRSRQYMNTYERWAEIPVIEENDQYVFDFMIIQPLQKSGHLLNQKI